MDKLPLPANTPVSVYEVGLKAQDAEKLAHFYRDVIGLSDIESSNEAIVLGAGGRPLLTIEQDSSAKPDDQREAGLFHTAFLLPSRADLARWARRALEQQIPIEGASDHLVSEALYLSDPEGNGIEIYADRPKEAWVWEDDEVSMKTLRLNFDDLFASAGEDAWNGAPGETIIGHVHLRVGDPAEAERWWHEAVGLDTTARRRPDAVFMSSGSYHHHIAANAWHSTGAGRRDPARAGLAWVSLRSENASVEKTLEDPWGTVVRILPKAH